MTPERIRVALVVFFFGFAVNAQPGMGDRF
jgi:hypothetical protein